MVIFKLLVKELRIFKKMTQNELAALAHISQGYLNDIERGRRIPSLFVLEKISKALKVNMGTLIQDDINYPYCENGIVIEK